VNSAVQNKIANIVETRLNGGQRVTVVNLAKEMKVSVGEVRNALVEAFGNRVVFKRGRTGGIYLT
jgi:DNA-binding GntR family transcriptional regulator